MIEQSVLRLPSSGMDNRDSSGPEAGALWRPLAYFNLYRLAIAGLFLAFVLWGVAPRLFDYFNLNLFRITAFAYLVFSIVNVFSIRSAWLSFDSQVFVQVSVDIIAITLMMHSCGGIASGFGILLVASIAGASMLAEGRHAVLFAAVASLAILSQEVYSQLSRPYHITSYTQVGLFGVALFATAFLAFVLARRVRASDALAARRGVDLANLSHLNEHIIQRMQSGILAVDAEERLRLVNESGRALLQMSSGEGGQQLAIVAPQLADLLADWRSGGFRSSSIFKPAQGEVEVMASFAGLGEESIGGVLVFLEDASAMRQRAQQLKLASLGRLAASVAHEIRNPLGAISHAGQLLAEAGLDESEMRLAQIINQNSERMNVIIENVLHLSRRKAAEPETFELRQWLSDFVESFRAISTLDGMRIEVQVEPAELDVTADPSQLQQVVWNLCENGLKHAGEPPRLQLRGGFNVDAFRPYLDVIDNGDGIAPDVADHLFEPFFTTRSDGTGLGLYIARELCEGNKASLNHVPLEGGCCFRITFADPRREGHSNT